MDIIIRYFILKSEVHLNFWGVMYNVSNAIKQIMTASFVKREQKGYVIYFTDVPGLFYSMRIHERKG